MPNDFLASARKTFAIEIAAVQETLSVLDTLAFKHSCELLLRTTGRVIVMGVGKSGHIANKIASTLASTGTPAFFLHPSEAAHGDMGMVRSDDVVIMLSKSGSSDELYALLPAFARVQVPIIAITASEDSRLVEASKQSGGAVLRIQCSEEACPHDLAPTASTTASLVIGDALAIALLEARQFTSDDFARLHPAGALGKRLTLSVGDLMARGVDIPIVSESATLSEVMLEMSSKRFGATAVLQEDKIAGIITDGDLRRYFQSVDTVRMAEVCARDIMMSIPRTVFTDMLAIEALRLMEETLPKVLQLLVIDRDGKLAGIVHMHDLVRTGIGA